MLGVSFLSNVVLTVSVDMDKLAARACQGRIRTFHGQQIAEAMLRREALQALDCAEIEPLRDENHRVTVELLRRLAARAVRA